LKSNKEIESLFDNNLFASLLGCKIIDILETCDIINKQLNRESYTKTHYDLKISDEKMLALAVKHKVYVLPQKLPMIVKPNSYSKYRNGGYLLNFRDEIIIEKSGQKEKSKILSRNIIYKLVNGISQTPFKINEEVLDFILNNNSKFNFYIDENKPHKFEDALTNTARKKSYKKHVSQLMHQKTVLEIVNTFKGFSEIYFPVRIDKRGRMYCLPSYFSYQGDELSKSLIMFANPGTIKRTDVHAINNLKSYGINCFGGTESKKALEKKLS
jgi:DNA-directed RNA polymerase